MSGRWRWAVAIVVMLAAAAGAAYVVTSSGNSPGRTPKPHALARAAALTPVGGAGVMPTAAGIRRALAAALADPAFGGVVDGEVVDAATGTPLFSRGADASLPPASTAKLLTAAAALLALGGDAVLTTDTVQSGRTIYLIGRGDVTLTATPRPSAYPVPANLADLARRTAAALTGSGPYVVRVDTSAWSGPAAAPGWDSGYFTDGDIARLSPVEVDEARVEQGQLARFPDPATNAGEDLVKALRADGVDVSDAVGPGAAPPSGLGLATVSSPPVSALVQRMLTDSDNDLAESLGRAVAVHDGQPPTFAGEAKAVLARIAALGVDTTGVHLDDASGLSRLDRVTAAALVATLQLAISSGHPELRPIVQGLPVAAFTGTLADRDRAANEAAAAGALRAKTGTLVGVNGLAGEVVDADGRLLVFAFLTDRAQDPDRTEAAIDRLAAALAPCGCA